MHDIVQDGVRVGQVLDDIRVLFGQSKRDKEPIDMNDTVLETMKVLLVLCIQMIKITEKFVEAVHSRQEFV